MGLEKLGEDNGYEDILADIKQRRQLGQRLSADDELVDQVRDYEKAEAAAASTPGMDKLTLLDPLTELYNFRTFVKELKAELTRARRYKQACSIVVLTIDNFDDIAQQYGYLTGEAVLRVVANTMRGQLRDTDLPCKYGSQEFAIILPETPAAGACTLGERLRQRIANQAIAHNWQSFSVTASIGTASYPMHAETHEELLARAIEALQHALERGGDRVLSV